MAKYLRPRRGKYEYASSQNIALKRGEMFICLSNNDDVGKGPGALYIGDGASSFSQYVHNGSTVSNTAQPILVHPMIYKPIFANSNPSASGWTVDAATAEINNIGNGTANVTLPNIIGNVKGALSKHANSINALDKDKASKDYVDNAIDALPEPMVYKGTLGTGGTITNLPAAAEANEGFTYKVITNGTYASQEAHVGDMFTSNGTSWVLFPAGDTDTDTWRPIKVNGTEVFISGISSGSVDFVNGNNTNVSYNSTNKTIQVNATYSNMTSASAGLAPAGGSGTTKYLRQDGTWQVPPDNDSTYALTEGTENGTVNFNDNGTTANVPVKGLGAMAYKASVSKSDVGLGNVANINQSKAIKSITRNGLTFTATALDNSTFNFTQQDNNTTYDVATTTANGLLPKLGGGTTNFLRADGTWVKPPNDNTTYSNMTSASAGLAPAGGSGTTKYLRQDGTWQVPPDNNTTYGVATTASNGLLPKLGGGTTNFLRADGTWVKPPNDNTTYSNMTSASAGLAPAGGSGTTKYLRQDGTWQVPPDNNTTYTNGTGLSLSNGTFSINENASTVKYAKNAATATADGSGNTITSYYAPKASPAFTGTPTVPDVADGDTSGKIANTKFVATAIGAAIAGVTQFDYEVVTKLPSTGKKGVMYLVLNGSSTSQNIYDEYIWLTDRFEKIATTEIDLSNYVNTVSETGTGNAYTSFTKSGNTLTLSKGSTFLTSIPAQYATTATYTAGNGISKSGTQFSNSGVRAVATGTENGTVNVNTNGTTANVAVHGLGAMAYKASVSKSDVGLGNVANINQSKAIKSITRNGLTFTATAIDGSTFNFTQQDNNTTYGNMTSASAGLAPAGGSGTTKYLRQDGTWVKPPNDNTTYGNMTSASAGLAPAGGSGTTKYLRQDGTWQVPPDNNTTYGNMTSASAGLAPAGGSGTTKYLRQDGTWQVPPDNNTTYGVATTASNGLLPKLGGGTTNFLRADGSWAATSDTKVTQTESTANNNYEVLLSNNASTATATNGVNKSSGMKFNPSTGNLTISGKLTVGAAPTNNMDVATKKYVDNAINVSITQALAASY
jgi:hypothetical protein